MTMRRTVETILGFLEELDGGFTMRAVVFFMGRLLSTDSLTNSIKC